MNTCNVLIDVYTQKQNTVYKAFGRHRVCSLPFAVHTSMTAEFHAVVDSKVLHGYPQKAPNAWHRRGTQNTGNNYNYKWTARYR